MPPARGPSSRETPHCPIAPLLEQHLFHSTDVASLEPVHLVLAELVLGSSDGKLPGFHTQPFQSE